MAPDRMTRIPTPESGPAIEFHLLPAGREVDAGEIHRLLDERDRKYMQECRAETRKAEYGRSRWLMRSCLAASGIDAAFSAVPRPDGTVGWPAGVRASLSHKHGDIAFAFSPGPGLPFGIDIETSDRDFIRLREKLVTGSEGESLEARLGRRLNQQDLCVIFSFKESVFKCLFPSHLKFFWFHDFAVEAYDENTPAMSGKLTIDLSADAAKGKEINGWHCRLDGKRVLTFATEQA